MKSWPKLTAAEAASLINAGATVGFSGFTPAGSPKEVPTALAHRARALHAAGEPFQIGVVTGASTGPSLDGALACAEAIAWRTPYQSDAELRKSINAGRTPYFDMHLSTVAQSIRYGFLGKIDCAVVEAAEITPDGGIVPTSAVSITPTICHQADKIIVELNRHHPAALRGFHDCYEPADPPHRREIRIFTPSDRIGAPVVQVDPAKIVGVVETDREDEVSAFEEPTAITDAIGVNVAEFLAAERRKGRIPSAFLPVQSGVGNIANAVLGAMGRHSGIPPFAMYTEVIQNAVIDLIRQGKVTFASGVSLTVTPEVLRSVYSEMESFRPRLLLRPQEIANNPEVVRRLGLITVNTAIELDIFGNINSTHVLGQAIMNGIGGSGDFTRNAYLSIFTCPSIAKGGRISTIVPLASHIDHSEHSVSVIITERGIADLRGKSPEQRAELIVEQCAHPDYQPLLREYFARAVRTHEPRASGALKGAFAMHAQYLETGDMRHTDWARYF